MTSSISWAACRERSDEILADGLAVLCSNAPVVAPARIDHGPGNYLVTLQGVPQYMGEAEGLAARIRSQFRERTSTFYKTYLGGGVGASSPISEFGIQWLSVSIGRKELEEFGIVHRRCPLNKFQLGKRRLWNGVVSPGIWSEVQRGSSAIAAEAAAELMGLTPKPWGECVVPAAAGIYIVRAPDTGEVLYVGESSDIGERYRTHGTRTYFSALRRHVATEVLGFELIERNGKRKYLAEAEDARVTGFVGRCRLVFQPISFGRFEIEKHLIRTLRPVLNRKDRAE